MKEDDDVAMMNEIAKLAGRINNYRQRGQSSGPSRASPYLRSRRGAFPKSPVPFSRGGMRGRGRGRGGVRGGRPYPQRSPRSASNGSIDRPCSHFTRTGTCNAGLSCRYQHDPDHVAICDSSLRGTCANPLCTLSHTPRPENAPMCVHYARGHCTRDNCPYTHMTTLAPNASVCPEFALLGWCDKGSACKDLHVNECPDFNRMGTCPRGESCRMSHVRRARKRTTPENENRHALPGTSSNQHIKISDVLGTLDPPETIGNSENSSASNNQDQDQAKSEENHKKEKQQDQNSTEHIGTFFDNASTSGIDGNDDFIELE